MGGSQPGLGQLPVSIKFKHLCICLFDLVLQETGFLCVTPLTVLDSPSPPPPPCQIYAFLKGQIFPIFPPLACVYVCVLGVYIFLCLDTRMCPGEVDVMFPPQLHSTYLLSQAIMLSLELTQFKLELLASLPQGTSSASRVIELQTYL